MAFYLERNNELQSAVVVQCEVRLFGIRLSGEAAESCSTFGYRNIR